MIGFAENGKIVMDLFYSPDEFQGTKFISEFANSRFVHDLDDGKIEFHRHYVILHCNSCEKKRYTRPKENCISGGRYCALSNRDNVSGESVLFQDLYNICTEKVVLADKTQKGSDGLGNKLRLMGYYSNFDKYCVEDMKLSCTKKILEKMNILKEVEKCFNDGFVMQKGAKEVRYFLDDNKLLKEHKQEFMAVKNFNRFPLLKIGDVVYYGPLKADNVFAFICKHVKQDLLGCGHYIRKIDGKGNNFLTIVIILSVAIVFLWLLNKCKTSLRIRFERQLNYQVDESINKFLERTGGEGL